MEKFEVVCKKCRAGYVVYLRKVITEGFYGYIRSNMITFEVADFFCVSAVSPDLS